MARIKGRDLMLYRVGADGKANPKAFACARTCSLNINAETEEIADKDSSLYGDAEVKRFSWEASTENLIADFDTYASLVETMQSGEKLTLLFAPTSNITDDAVEKAEGGAWTPIKGGKLDGLYGVCLITSISANAPNDSQASYTVQLKGAGKLRRIDKADRPQR